ncbi:MAG: hypothetical protein KatS3mg104_1017 [Phycisphaerae bacterium]|nr:MAG: hypothetical protein KatS3mg104_1017 [Phycisphaerae bacterium]
MNRHPHRDPFVESSEPLMGLAGMGQEIRSDESYYYDARRRLDRPHVVFQLTLEGTGFYKRGGKRHLLNPNTAFMDQIPGDFEYGYAAESPGPYRFLFVSMSGKMAFQWMKRIHRQFGAVHFFGNDDSIADQLRTIIVPHEQQWLDRYQQSAVLYALVMQIYSVLMRSRIEQSALVCQAIRRIHSLASDPGFGVGDLARILECSREHLARQFQQATGLSPMAYLSRVRLQWAAHELRSSEDKLEVVARKCGFSSANYLCRMFRKRWGVTPAQYRQNPGMVLIA